MLLINDCGIEKILNVQKDQLKQEVQSALKIMLCDIYKMYIYFYYLMKSFQLIFSAKNVSIFSITSFIVIKSMVPESRTRVPHVTSLTVLSYLFWIASG